MINMRGHHLLCILTFEGVGYNACFTDNFVKIVERLSAGEEVVIVAGPDDICKPVMAEGDSHCRLARVDRRDDHALKAVSALIGRQLSPGSTVHLNARTVEALRSSFVAGTIREACDGCEWHDLCSRIAVDGFDRVKFLPIS